MGLTLAWHFGQSRVADQMFLSLFAVQDALNTFQWSLLVPQFFDRVWSELALARFASQPQYPAEDAFHEDPKEHSRQIQAAIDALTPVCAERGDDVIQWDSSLQRVVQTSADLYVGEANLTCPSIIMLISGWDRSIGVCQDAAQMAAHWGHIPLLPASVLAKLVGQQTIHHAVAAGRLSRQHLGVALKFHEFCAGSVIFSLSVAYGELVDIMKEGTAGPMPLHKYW